MFSLKYLNFTYDDSFIIYRYAENLANGYGFSWNYNGVPEFGFTSYFHTILVAGGINLGFDPLVFSKTLTIFCGIIVLIVVGFTVREFTERKFEYYFLPSLALGFLPHFGLHAVSGMETIMFVMFFVLTTYSYLVFLRTNKTKHLGILIILIILTTFTRYEGALLSFGIIIHQFYNRLVLKNSINYTKIGIFCIPIIFLIGILIVNDSYQDQILPNPFFMKSTTELSDLVRNSYFISFVLVLMIAHILLIVLNFKEIIKNPKSSYFLIQIMVMLLPFLLVSQWGNFQYRYYFHVIPLIISLSIFSFYLIKPKIIHAQKHPKFIIFIILVVLISYNLSTNWEVRTFAENWVDTLDNTQIKIGKVLGEYDHLKHNTIATVIDAGAVPYYSGWQVYDYTFNDRYTTKHGFTSEYFYQQNPVIITLNHHSGYPQDDLIHLEDNIIKYYQNKQGNDEKAWISHPEFDNFKLIASYPKILVFVEKEFATQNPDLIQDLIDNSSNPLSIP
jgi:arabinofuranosyltransferase